MAQTIPRNDFEQLLQEHARKRALDDLEAWLYDFPVDMSEPLAEMFYEGLSVRNRIFVERLPQLVTMWEQRSLNGNDPWQDVERAIGCEGQLTKEEQEELICEYFDTYTETLNRKLMSILKEMLGKGESNAEDQS